MSPRRAAAPSGRGVQPPFIIVTGISGSGKSQAIRALEDLGYFCVDNLPTALIPTLAQLAVRGGLERAAVVVDVREQHLLSAFPTIYRKLRAMSGLSPKLIFLDAADESLVRRFSETRRPHPMGRDRSVVEIGAALSRRDFQPGICVGDDAAERLPKFLVVAVARLWLGAAVVVAECELEAAVGKFATLAPAVAVVVDARDEARVARVRFAAALRRHVPRYRTVLDPTSPAAQYSNTPPNRGYSSRETFLRTPDPLPVFGNRSFRGRAALHRSRG